MSVYFPVSQGYSLLEPTGATTPNFIKMVKAPNSAGAYIFNPTAGNKTTLGKIESPTAFTHARVRLLSEGACSGIKIAVAPTSRSSNATASESFNPYNGSGVVDLSLWQTGTMPDITSEMVTNPNSFGSPYLRSSVSDLFQINSIPDSNGKHHLLIRLQTQFGEHTIVGDNGSSPSAMTRYTNAAGQEYYRMFLAVGSAGITDAHDFNQIGSNPLTGGYCHLFAIEFGVAVSNAVSVIAIGDSITADAVTSPSNVFNIWPLVGAANALAGKNKPLFFTNAAMSARNEGFMASADIGNNGWGYGNHYDDLLSTGANFDYVICPAFTPNGGAPNTVNSVGVARDVEQKAWLDYLVDRTLSEGSILVLWEGIPNNSYGTTQDVLRVSINDYGQTLANNNAHVHYIRVGSQVDTRATPNRHIPEFSADDFHLVGLGNNAIAEFVQYELDRIINGTTVPALGFSASSSPADPAIGETITFTAVDTGANTIYWQSSELALSSNVGNVVTATAIDGAYTVTSNARGAAGEQTITLSDTVSTPNTAPTTPTASAGTNQTGIPAGSTNFFDFSGSSADVLRWSVRQTAGDKVLVGGLGGNKVFVAPTKKYGQTLTFELEVTNGYGLSDTDTVSFGVLAREELPLLAIIVSSVVEEEFSRLRGLGYVGALQDMKRQELLDV